VIVEIKGVNGPGRRCRPSPEHGPYEDVHVGVGSFRDPIGLVHGDALQTSWKVQVRLAWRDGRPDFRGPHVDGRPGDRHIYVDWFNREPDGELMLFRRAKVMLEGIDPSLVKKAEESDTRLICTVNLTNEKGLPTTARFWAPDLRWSIADAIS
jgi:hypothetical protein